MSTIEQNSISQKKEQNALSNDKEKEIYFIILKISEEKVDLNLKFLSKIEPQNIYKKSI